ncbi:hypothetical protein [Pseudomonas sp.]|uniref:hypothetical protein n=1 Tax=Pseudomonas sp. TaxID=306 RepID=UPI0019DFF294|nr:hypothetical protein [Pseudomonas sp.]MBF0674659.1 hypothetical protein [Pseudomonas sp.]
MDAIYDKPELTGEEIQKEIFRRFEKYNEKPFFECFALYLGTAQILEFALKKLLEEEFNVPAEQTEHKTLGQTRVKLEEIGLRSDYTELLKIVVKDRNHAAHELLANQAVIGSLGIELSEHFQFKELNPLIYNLEKAVFLFDYMRHNKAWTV